MNSMSTVGFPDWFVGETIAMNEQQKLLEGMQVVFSGGDCWFQEADRPYICKYVMRKIILKEKVNNNYPLDRNFKMHICNQN